MDGQTERSATLVAKSFDGDPGWLWCIVIIPMTSTSSSWKVEGPGPVLVLDAATPTRRSSKVTIISGGVIQTQHPMCPQPAHGEGLPSQSTPARMFFLGSVSSIGKRHRADHHLMFKLASTDLNCSD